MLSKAMMRLERVAPMKIGIFLLIATLLAGGLLFQKQKLSTVLSGGDEVQAAFTRDYRLRPYVTEVKVAGIPVGKVTSIEHSGGEAVVTMKIHEEAKEKLRSTPSAAIRPKTLLGGNYYVDLRPGGDPGDVAGVIPASRTTVPVELDRVLEVLKPETRTSLQRTAGRLDRVLDDNGSRALRRVLRTGPQALAPAGRVLTAARGTRPEQDLSSLVTNLETVGRVLGQDKAALASIIDNAGRTSALLARTGPSLGAALESLPPSMRQARTGLSALGGTLDQLESTAGGARPVARELDGLLTELRPALTAVRPVVRDLRPAVRDLRPLLTQLVPSASTATRVLEDVDGAPLERVNGPILDGLLSPFKGTGEWEGGGSDVPAYKVLAQFITGLSHASKMTDANGATIGFHPGAGLGSLTSETPVDSEEFIRQLLYPQGAQ